MEFLYSSVARQCFLDHRLVQAPTTAIISGLVAFTAIILAGLIRMTYNTVTVDESKTQKTLNSPGTSNTYWMLYYCHVFLRHGVSAVRYSIQGQHPTLEDSLTLVALIVHGLGTLFLSLSLEYQRKYRGGRQTAKPPDEFVSEDELSDLRRRYSSASPTTVFVGFLLMYEVSAYMTSNSGLQMEWVYWVFIGMAVLQYIPVMYLTYAICGRSLWDRCCVPVKRRIWGHAAIPNGFHALGQGPNRDDCQTPEPTTQAKVVLLVAMVLRLLSQLPVSFWNNFPFKHTKCFLVKLFSEYDLILLCDLSSALLFFSFMHHEYMRNKEEAVFNYIAQSQEKIDSRGY